MRKLSLLYALLLSALFGVEQEAFADDMWISPQNVTNWSGKGETRTNQCQYKAGDGSIHGVANTIDNNFDTSWNAHPCRKSSWFLVYDLGEEKPVNSIQLRSAGNGWHDPRNFVLYSCSDANGSSCTQIKSCSRSIEEGKNNANNQAYQRCDFTEQKGRYFKITMRAWKKSWGRFREGGGGASEVTA